MTLAIPPPAYRGVPGVARSGNGVVMQSPRRAISGATPEKCVIAPRTAMLKGETAHFTVSRLTISVKSWAPSDKPWRKKFSNPQTEFGRSLISEA